MVRLRMKILVQQAQNGSVQDAHYKWGQGTRVATSAVVKHSPSSGRWAVENRRYPEDAGWVGVSYLIKAFSRHVGTLAVSSLAELAREVRRRQAEDRLRVPW